jgi:glycosyltransferase involved in cell wall biosynthesis
MNTNNPMVSIILPTYNRAQLIGRAIQSVLDQTYQDFELIIVDDGSKDNTADISDFKDKRIRYIRHEKNKGANAARNAGIKMARGEYIGFQDSDDEWLPEKLEKQMRVFKTASADVGVVYTGFWRIEEDRKMYIPSPEIKQKEGNIHTELLHRNFVTTQAVVIMRECFNKAGLFDEFLPRLQDWELFIRIAKHYSFRCIDEPLLISYFTSKSISANQEALISAHLYILEKHYNDLRLDKRLLAYHYFNIGHTLCLSGGFDQGKGFLKKALQIAPLNIKYQGAALASRLGKDVYIKIAECYIKMFDVTK